MTASTTTTIRGVSIFSRQRKRKADVFDIALSPEGIVIRRPGRTEQHMTWERIAQWEIEEQPDCIVLTLRGGGSVTPLMVKGWTLDGPRDRHAGRHRGQPQERTPRSDPRCRRTSRSVSTSAGTALAAAANAAARRAGAAPAPRAVRRHARSTWKALVTVVLLGVLATAVVVVLLQSAGVISWSFLGPVA